MEDKLIWECTRSGEFTVRTAAMTPRKLEERKRQINQVTLVTLMEDGLESGRLQQLPAQRTYVGVVVVMQSRLV